MVRYHRKGEVGLGDLDELVEPGDAARVGQLTALLRMAEFLERRKSQVVQSLQVEIGERVVVSAQTNGEADIEIWDANRSAGMFRKAFGREIEIVAERR
jgi:exopolyphosphatase/guanosine-5'-triphosphate,3'-diphosphate pyrophosphatase